MKIIHFHFDTTHNTGDEAAVLAIKDLLQAKFNIQSYIGIRLFALMKIKYSKLVENRIIKHKLTQNLINKIRPKLSTSNLHKAEQFLLKLKLEQDDKLLAKINAQDLCVIGGGGFYSTISLPLNLDLIQKIKIPIVIFGVGYNVDLSGKKLNPEQLESIFWLNQKAFLSSVRDKFTLNFLKQLPESLAKTKSDNNFTDKIYYTGDPAIFLQSETVENLKFEPTKLKIGINIAAHFDKSEQFTEKLIQIYLDSLDNLAKTQAIQVFYLQHSSQENKIVEILNQKWPSYDNLASQELIICSYRAKQLKFVYEHLDLVICMMLHSSILAFSSLIPIINIAYNQKNINFMQDINQQEFLLDLETLEVKNLEEKLQQLIINQKQIKTEFTIVKSQFDKLTKNFLDKL